MNKIELRREFISKRKELSLVEVDDRSQFISAHFFTYFENHEFAGNSPCIHTFLPIRRQPEVDTWPIIKSIWKLFPQIQVAVSVTNNLTNSLTHHALHPYTDLKENRWGIPEPLNANQESAIASEQFDLVLVPLLIFDQQGNRVGYGGGYYDRFMAECRPNCQKIGLSLFEPVKQIDDIEPTDVPLNVCITPNQPYFF